MKQITCFYLETCPYCRQAKRAIEELTKENPKYNEIVIVWVEESEHPDIADKYDIDKRKTASILDIFSSCWQGIIPYGAQLLTAAGVAAISPVEIIPFLYYPGLMFICGILSITFSNVLLKNIKSNEVA